MHLKMTLPKALSLLNLLFLVISTMTRCDAFNVRLTCANNQCTCKESSRDSKVGMTCTGLDVDICPPLGMDLSFTTLKISESTVSALESKALASGSMDSLILSGVNLKSVGRDAFQDVICKDLDLSNNQLSTLPPEVFEPLSNYIFTINLDNNELESLVGVFKNLPLLESIELANNKLSTLSSDLFIDSTIISFINLKENALVSLCPKMLKPLSNANVLLESNPDLVVAYCTGSCNPSVFLLEATIETDSEGVCDCESEDGCLVVETVEEILPMTGTEICDVCACKREEETLAIMCSGYDAVEMPFLETTQIGSIVNFTFTNSTFSSIPAHAFEMLGVSLLTAVVKLASIGLTSLDKDCFVGAGSISSLNLENNHLWRLPESVLHPLADSLLMLSLAGNQLTYLPKALFEGMLHLAVVDLSNNQIPRLPVGFFDDLNSFDKMINLEVNEIDSLCPSLVYGLGSTRVMALDSNPINDMVVDGCIRYCLKENEVYPELEVGGYSDVNENEVCDCSSGQGCSTNYDQPNIPIESIRDYPADGGAPLIGFGQVRLGVGVACVFGIAVSRF